MKLIYIEWADAVSPHEGAWKTEEEAIEWGLEDDFWCSDVGWLLKETKDCIVIASRRSITQTGEEKLIQYGGLFRIPKPWIRKRKILKL